MHLISSSEIISVYHVFVPETAEVCLDSNTANFHPKDYTKKVKQKTQDIYGSASASTGTKKERGPEHERFGAVNSAQSE